MRILHVIDHLGLGGGQTALVDMLTSWPDEGDEFELVSLGRQDDFAPLLSRCPNLTLNVLGGSRWNFGVVRHVAKRLASGEFDIVHAHLAKATCAALWARPHGNAPLVVHAQTDPDRDSRLLRVAMNRWKQRLGALIGVSQRTSEIAVRWWSLDPRSVHTIPNAVDFTRLEGPAEPVHLRQRLGLAPETFVVGFLGRLHPQKGLPYLFQALRQVRQTNANVAAVLVGDGPLAEELKRAAAELGLQDCVHFVGAHTTVAPWIRELDVGVLPSLYEGLPLSLIEMMGLGKTVVATDVSGTSELVIDGETGLLVPPADPTALATAILRLADSPALVAKLAESAQRHARNNFSAAAQCRRIREIYLRLLEPVPAAVVSQA